MSAIDFRIRGLEQSEKNLKQLGAVMQAKTLRGALRDAAKPYEDVMKSVAPVSKESRTITKENGQKVTISPGFLRSRIKRRSYTNTRGRINRRFKKNEVAMVRVGVFRVPYVGHIEFGTQNHAASPFIRPALYKTPEVVNLFSLRAAARAANAAKRMKKQ